VARILIVDDEVFIRDVISEAFAAGADDYILKPLSFPLLRDKVAWALSHRR
jgi:CheY-like chemotaxis protein